jgi:hypothetical protein
VNRDAIANLSDQPQKKQNKFTLWANRRCENQKNVKFAFKEIYIFVQYMNFHSNEVIIPFFKFQEQMERE